MINGKATWKPGFYGWLSSVLALALVLLGGSALLSGPKAWSQESARKVKTSVMPEYPELARKLKIKGTVRVEITIAPDGTVKKVKEIGGSPVLIEAMVRAVKKWKYEPAAKESLLEVKFEFTL